MSVKGNHRHMKGSMVSNAPSVPQFCLHPYHTKKKREWSKSKVTVSFEARAYKIK